jgi:hypothetical protein
MALWVVASKDYFAVRLLHEPYIGTRLLCPTLRSVALLSITACKLKIASPVDDVIFALAKIFSGKVAPFGAG